MTARRRLLDRHVGSARRRSSLPVANVADLERYEGMLVQFDQTLTATEVFNLGRFGEVSLSGAGRLYNPTAVATPGAPAIAQAGAEQPQPDHPRRRQQPAEHRPDALPAGRPVGDEHAARRRHAARPRPASWTSASRNYRIQPVGPVAFTHTNPRTPAPAAVGGNLKVASFNVLNFFNGDGLRRRLPDRARREHAVRARPPAGEGCQRAARRSTPTSSA